MGTLTLAGNIRAPSLGPSLAEVHEESIGPADDLALLARRRARAEDLDAAHVMDELGVEPDDLLLLARLRARDDAEAPFG